MFDKMLTKTCYGLELDLVSSKWFRDVYYNVGLTFNHLTNILALSTITIDSLGVFPDKDIYLCELSESEFKLLEIEFWLFESIGLDAYKFYIQESLTQYS